MNKSGFRSTLLCGTAAMALLLAAAPQDARAQMYSSGPGFYLSAEGRYMWNAGDRIRSYNAMTTPVDIGISGAAERASPGWGGKAMLGYRFSNNWDVGLGFSGAWLKGKNSSAQSTVLHTSFVEGGATFTPTITDRIKVKLDYQVADFEAGYNWTMGASSNLRLFGGIRFAHFSQNVKADAAPGSGTTITGFSRVSAKRKTTFWGVGPRLGVNGQFGIGDSGFNIFGGFSGALLIGKFKDKHSVVATATSTHNNGQSNFTSFSSRDKSKTKLVPNLEGELGIGYQFNTGGGSTVGLQLGYRGDAWWGVSSKAPPIAAPGSSQASDQFFHGPFVRLVATFGAAAATPAAPPPPPPPAAMAKKSFIVFFDFDKSNITSQAQATINDAVAAAKAGNSARVTLTGHTDRSGSEQYNLALSLRRAEAVKGAMIKQGIPASAIVVIGKGESQPLVPTADGVREPQNRRVEIVI